MAQRIGTRTTAHSISESRAIRIVGDAGLLLQPTEQPLVTFLLNLSRGPSVKGTKLEWFEEDYIERWVSAANTYDSNDTDIEVSDASVIVVGDVLLVPKAVDDSAAPEQMLVTAVNYGTDTLTVTRAFAGTTGAAITNGDAIAILGQAFAEATTYPESKVRIPTGKTTYTQIFKKTKKISGTQAATEIYAANLQGGSGDERAKQHELMLREMKIAMNRQFYWGKASEDLADPDAPIRTTMGLNSEVTTNVFDAGGILTRKAMEEFSRDAFRYGASTKILMCAPKIISAIHAWGDSFMQVGPREKVYGVSINRVVTGHGEWILVRDWSLEDGVAGKNGFSGWAFSLDPAELEYGHLAFGKENRDLKIYQDVDLGRANDRYVDLALAEVYFKVKHEKKHAKLFNVADYAS